MARWQKLALLVTAGFGAVQPVFAADFPEMRSALPIDWSSDAGDPLGFEFGLRYWYSRGGQNVQFGSGTAAAQDTTHILEGHLRIDDYSTNTFFRALAGYSLAISGDYWNDLGSGSTTGGQVGYVGGDFGGYWFGDPNNGLGVGGFVGYQYQNESPDTGRVNYTTAASASDITWSTTSTYWTVPYASKPNNININMLRLGLSAKANLGAMADISLDVAGIPYANISGTLGGFGVTTTGSNPTYIQSSPVEAQGWGYGAAADLMLGFRPVENMVIRLGGRAQYLQGTYDGTYSVAAITDQQDSNSDGTYDVPPVYSNQNYISTNNPFSMWRLGALLELTYSF